MARFAFFIVFFLTLICSCSDKVPVANSPAFKSFEISYSNGWTKSFSFIVDSNKIYFSPQRGDTAYYGSLPDTVLKVFETTFLKISDQTIQSKDAGCVDCSVVAIKIVSNGDTTRIQQLGGLDHIFYPLIRTVQRFLDSSKHQTIQAVVRLETKSIVTPPPPRIEATKFKPPIMTRRSGR